MSSALPLFRPEALAAQQAQWLGVIRIAQPLGLRLVAGVSLLLSALLIAYALWGQITRKARLPGLVAPAGGVVTIAAPQSGVLAEVLVREGEQVAPGQPLARLRSERITASGDAAALHAQALAQRRAALDAERLLTRQQADQRRTLLAERQRSLQTEERQLASELEMAQQRVKLAQTSERRLSELAQNGFVSPAQAQQAQESLLDLQARERSVERALSALRRDLQAAAAEAKATPNQLQTTLSQLERQLASLSQEAAENAARSELTLTAPQGGRVSALTLHPGQSIQAGQTLLSLLPQSEHSPSGALEAQLYAPSRTTGFVQPGQTVWLRYAAYPYQKFGMAEGTVTQVSQTPIAPQDLPPGQAQALMQAAQSNEPLYRVSVRLARQHIPTYGHPTPLKAGMQLEADVRQETLRIWEWALEPVLAAAGLSKTLNSPTTEANSLPREGRR